MPTPTSRALRTDTYLLDLLETRRLLSAVRPVISALDAPRDAAMDNVLLGDAFAPLNRLVEPNASAKSYLNLAAYTPFQVDFERLKQTLQDAPTRDEILSGDAQPLVVALPNPEGQYSRFKVFDSEILAPELAAEFPEIRTFTGQGIDDPTATLAMDFTLQGFHAAVQGESGRYYIDPFYHLHPEAGQVAYWTSDNLGDPALKCLVEDDEELHEDDHEGEDKNAPLASDLVSGTSWLGATLRTYRLAIGTTGEYTVFHGGTVPLGLSAVTTTAVRLNQVYETDYAIRMTLVANQSSVIYTNASTDPYTAANDAEASIGHNQTALDSVIGNANYDIGHVYYRSSSSNDNNGLAGAIGNVGVTGQKAEGYTAYTSPIGDNFVIDFVAHEMGHQFAGRHNFNSAGGGPGDQYSLGNEPGSGQSIMGYAGLGTTQENILTHSLAQFNANNFVTNSGNTATQILQYTLTNTGSAGYTSAAKTSTGNTPPSVSVDASSFSIPVSTPFALTASGSDANGDSLTYSWEQMNGSSNFSAVALSTVGGIASVPSSTTTNGPVFRVFAPTTSPTRNFPVLSAILAGRTYDKGEQLPSVARIMAFAVVARDNRAGGGGVAIGRVTVSTIASSAFTLNTFNTSTSVNGGSSQVINWSNTNTGAGTTINAANVNILLSTDGGSTFPITLASNVTNDGSQSVTMPYNVGTTAARIKIVPTNNIFFDINNSNFTINLVSNTSATPTAPLLVSTFDTGVSNSDNITRLNNSSPGNALQFFVNSTVSGALVELLADGVVIGSATATGTLTVINTNGTSTLADGVRIITARQTETGKTVSAVSAGTNITIESAAPAFTAAAFNGLTSPQRVTFTFGETLAVSGSGVASIVDRDTLAVVPSTLGTAGAVATLTVGGSGILPDGNYRASLTGGAVTDTAGNAAPDQSVDFHFLNGDATGDRLVDAQDFNILAGSFGLTGQNFSQGNFSFDAPGDIDSQDFNLFIAQYGKRLAPPAAALPGAPVSSIFTDAPYTPDRLEL